MTLPPTRIAALLPAALGLLVTAVPAGGQTTARIHGSVYDSTMHEPLADAAVILWDTPWRTATDSAGQYAFDELPPGVYDVVFFHERLGSMGISPGPRRVTLEAGDDRELQLATPSAFTLVASDCLLDPPAPGRGVLAGWVGDAESGMGLPGVTVTVSWQPDGGPDPPERMQLVADASGWYLTCDAPANVPLSVSAYFLDRQALMREVVVEEGTPAEATLLMGEYRPANVIGQLVDAASGEGVSDATVWLRGTSIRGLSGGDGRFSLGEVPPGTYMLMSEHLAYGTKMDTLHVPSGQRLAVEMHLDTRAIEIAPLTVTVDAQPITQRAMGGLLIDRADIDKVRARSRDLGDILRVQNVPGLIVRRQGQSLCIGYMPGQVRMMFRNACVPMIVFIDNVRTTNQDLAFQLPPESIDHVILYRPVEAGNLFGLGAANGVLAIFTKRR